MLLVNNLCPHVSPMGNAVYTNQQFVLNFMEIIALALHLLLTMDLANQQIIHYRNQLAHLEYVMKLQTFLLKIGSVICIIKHVEPQDTVVSIFKAKVVDVKIKLIRIYVKIRLAANGLINVRFHPLIVNRLHH